MIIEAFRINCWKALCHHFEVETVECCVIECCTGDPLQPGRVQIPRPELIGGLARVHAVDDTMLAMLRLDCPHLPALDDGEHHLMAWLHANPDDAVLTAISTADRAAIRATHVLTLLDRVTSLQQLGQSAGVGRKQLDNLQPHFQEDWLSTLRLQLRMNIL
ncbi:TPA: hypothetical protein ACXJGC_001553 [Burkholderia cenocepacia]|uniref:Uncharacterized protein n=1 Tax=Burkholderia latens TaxID=488446 RepID=A0A6H9STI2_9BURK|nr:hypothetical protein [Burkholderia latens]KAB0644542.1 hypothetical protein F7R21_01710 [Burkholderia latens]